jgi:hypothetical protein
VVEDLGPKAMLLAFLLAKHICHFEKNDQVVGTKYNCVSYILAKHLPLLE